VVRKKKRSTGTSIKPDEDVIVCQRRGLLESHAMSEAHKQSYAKYLDFIDRMHFDTEPIENNNKSKQSGNSISETNLSEKIKEENDM